MNPQCKSHQGCIFPLKHNKKWIIIVFFLIFILNYNIFCIYWVYLIIYYISTLDGLNVCWKEHILKWVCVCLWCVCVLSGISLVTSYGCSVCTNVNQIINAKKHFQFLDLSKAFDKQMKGLMELIVCLCNCYFNENMLFLWFFNYTYWMSP